MYKIYKYRWTGFFEYEGGDWYYCNKGNWLVSFDGQKHISVKSLAKVIDDKWKEIKTEYGSYFELPNNATDLDFVNWFTESPEQESLLRKTAKRALAVCLKHFGETSQEREVYTLLSNIVMRNMTVQISGIGEDKPCWFYINSGTKYIYSEEFAEYLMALNGLFFENLNLENLDQIRVKKNSDEVKKLLKSHRIKQTVTINYNRDDPNKISFTSIGEMTPYVKGRVCVCIPIPGMKKNKQGKEPCIVKTPEMVVDSPNVVYALKYLSQVWQDSFAKSVLISAPPGSGKDDFSMTIPYGTGRVKEENKTISLSLASGTKEELEELLYGKKTILGTFSSGYIEKAKDSVLFLDEVHHPEDKPEIRASLLRPLESNEYIPCGSKDPIDVRNVLFVLATSKPLQGSKNEKGLSDIPPQDFWTRMTHVVTIKHPFEGIWDSLPQIIESYFKFFWWERMGSFYEIDPETEIDQKNQHEENNLECEQLIEKMGKLYEDGPFEYKQRLEQMRKLKKDLYLENLAKIFRERLLSILSEERIQPHELSIRGFRNIVTRLFSISAARVIQGLYDQANLDDEIEVLAKNMDPVIYEIIEISKLNTD